MGANVGDDTMSHFLAEAVSEAMIREASDRGISGTAHIATPSQVGIKSTGVSVSGGRLWTATITCNAARRLLALNITGIRLSFDCASARRAARTQTAVPVERGFL